jgi:hypothetical protein
MSLSSLNYWDFTSMAPVMFRGMNEDDKDGLKYFEASHELPIFGTVVD